METSLLMLNEFFNFKTSQGAFGRKEMCILVALVLQVRLSCFSSS